MRNKVALRGYPESAVIVGQTFLSAEKYRSLADRNVCPTTFPDSL
jgi:hypothetical protein